MHLACCTTRTICDKALMCTPDYKSIIQSIGTYKHLCILARPTRTVLEASVLGSTIVDGPEVPEDRDPAQREVEGPRSPMDYSEFPLLDFSHQKKPGAPASPHRVTAVPRDVQWKGQRSQWRYMEKTEYSCYRSIYTYRQGAGYNAD